MILREKHRKLLLTLICTFTVAWLTAGCSRKAVFSQYAHTTVEGWGWNYSDTISFSFAPIPENAHYQGEIGLRCSYSFPFRELALVVEQEFFPDYRHYTDTVYVAITDDEGIFQGKGINYLQYTVPLNRQQYLHRNDSLSVRIRHCMRRENLRGIADVGFTLRRIE